MTEKTTDQFEAEFFETLVRRVNAYCTEAFRHDSASFSEEVLTEVSALIAGIHERNRMAGWWTDIRTGEPLVRNYGELLMLAVSELAEIPGEPRAVLNERDDKLPNRLMVEVELADFLLRIFDTAGAVHFGQFPEGMLRAVNYYGHSKVDVSGYDVYKLPMHLFPIVRLLSVSLEGCRKLVKPGESPDRKEIAWPLARAAFCAFRIGAGLRLDVPGAICEKIAFNAKRADHQRENRLKEGGKKF